MNQTPFSDLFNEALPKEEHPEDDTIPLVDAVDHLLLQQRDAHFGANFSVMADYYEEEGVGCHPEIDLDRIYYLWNMEKELGQNLSSICLTQEEQEEVVQALGTYKGLRELPAKTNAALLADLILSEDEYPSKEIALIKEQGNSMTRLLIDLLLSESMRDPLSPGYGLAPIKAAQALASLGDAKAIRPLFETVGRDNFELEETCLGALYRIGEAARDFLIKVLEGRPLTPDNERAALALAHFRDDPIVREECLKQLSDPETENASGFRAYLRIVVE